VVKSAKTLAEMGITKGAASLDAIAGIAKAEAATPSYAPYIRLERRLAGWTTQFKENELRDTVNLV
jgi:hypothetical protein